MTSLRIKSNPPSPSGCPKATIAAIAAAVFAPTDAAFEHQARDQDFIGRFDVERIDFSTLASNAFNDVRRLFKTISGGAMPDLATGRVLFERLRTSQLEAGDFALA